MSSKKQTPQKVFVILVALDFQNFDHYCMKPQIFYDTKQEAEKQMNYLLKTNEFEEVQLKIESLWKVDLPKPKN